MTLSIGIDLVACVPGRTGGIETYAVELTRALHASPSGARVVAFAQPALARLLAREGMHSVAAPGATSAEAAFWQAQTWLPAVARHHRLDVIHHTKNYAGARCATLRVVTLHDLFPAYLLLRQPWRQPVTRAGQLLAMLASARCADLVLTPSEATRAALSRFGAGGAPIRAVPLAPRTFTDDDDDDDRQDEYRRRHGLDSGGYFLTVAKPAAYKNLPALIAAYHRAQPRRALVITGVPAWRGASVARQIERAVAPARGRVTWLGGVDDAGLRALYRGARALVSPSLVEGFGLVPLEAASLGVACAVSDIAAHRETLGDAALRFDATDVDSIARALRTLDDDDALCVRLAAAGRARAGAFSWRATAERTLAAYEEALRERGAATQASATSPMHSMRNSGTSPRLVNASANTNGRRELSSQRHSAT